MIKNMLKAISFLILLNLVVFVESANAATLDVYPFSSKQQQAAFEHLTQQLRCLVCQNEDLADSNAGLAQDLRGQIYEMVEAGKSEQEVKNYMVARYGNFILFKPPANPETYVLWGAPLLILIVGFLVLGLVIRRRRRLELSGLTAEEEQRLQKLLRDSTRS